MGVLEGPFSMDAVPDIQWCEEEGYFRLTGRYGVVVHIQPKVFLGLAARVAQLKREWGERSNGIVPLRPGDHAATPND